MKAYVIFYNCIYIYIYIFLEIWQEIEIIAGNFHLSPTIGKISSCVTGKVAEFPFNYSLGNESNVFLAICKSELVIKYY